jgi:hypothetical protein
MQSHKEESEFSLPFRTNVRNPQFIVDFIGFPLALLVEMTVLGQLYCIKIPGLLRRCAPRNDICLFCHSDRSDSIRVLTLHCLTLNIMFILIYPNRQLVQIAEAMDGFSAIFSRHTETNIFKLNG